MHGKSDMNCIESWTIGSQSRGVNRALIQEYQLSPALIFSSLAKSSCHYLRIIPIVLQLEPTVLSMLVSVVLLS